MSPQQFAQLIPQLENKMREAIAVGLAQSAALIAEEAKRMIGHDEAEWPPLKESTIQHKGVDTPLLETGEMRDSIQFHVAGMSAYVGSNDPKAVIHEHGSEHIPPRPFLSTAVVHKMPEVITILTSKLQAALKE